MTYCSHRRALVVAYRDRSNLKWIAEANPTSFEVVEKMQLDSSFI